MKEIINLRHPLVRLAGKIDWDFLARRFRSVCRAGPGQPPLLTRLVVGLFILKHTHNLFDEVRCDRWVENPYFQYFCSGVPARTAISFRARPQPFVNLDSARCCVVSTMDEIIAAPITGMLLS